MSNNSQKFQGVKYTKLKSLGKTFEGKSLAFSSQTFVCNTELKCTGKLRDICKKNSGKKLNSIHVPHSKSTYVLEI